MFKRLLIFSVISFLCFTGAVFAQPDIGLGTASGIAQQGGLSTAGATQTGLAETVGRYVNWALSFTGVIFLLLTLYAGYLWMFGGGNEENIEKAKKILTSSVIGLIIVILSYGITALIMHFVAGTTAPEEYEVTPTGPSEYFGCCFTPELGCTKNIGEGPTAYTIPCGNCEENKKTQSECQTGGGSWFAHGCIKAMNDYDFGCSNYEK